MKKILLTLFFIYSTAFAQVPDSIEVQLQSIEQSIENNRSGLDSVDQRLTNIRELLAEKEQRVRAIRDGEYIQVTFPPSEQIDVQFRRLDDNQIHSVQWMLRNWSPPPPDLDPQSGEYTFKPSPNHDWEITVGAGAWKGAGFVYDWSESYIVDAAEQLGPPAVEEPVEKLDIFTFFWYDLEVPDYELKRLMNAGQHGGPNVKPLREIVDYGHRAIPYVGFETSDSESEIRANIRQRAEGFEEVGWDNIEYIILHDEPAANGFSEQQMGWMVDEANKQFKVPFTFTYTRSHAASADFPEGLNTVAFNYYPFYRADAPDGYMQVWDYESFADKADEVLDNIHRQIDDPKIIITAQAFETIPGSERTNPWRMPPPESADWYLRYAAKNSDVVGLGLWLHGTRNKWRGISTAPALEQAWVEALKEWVDLPVN